MEGPSIGPVSILVATRDSSPRTVGYRRGQHRRSYFIFAAAAAAAAGMAVAGDHMFPARRQ